MEKRGTMSQNSGSVEDTKMELKNLDVVNDCIPAVFEFLGDGALLSSSFSETLNDYNLPLNVSDIKDRQSIETTTLNGKWISLFRSQRSDAKSDLKLPFSKQHFIQAMTNVIKHPNINSTIILRSDMLMEIDPVVDEKDNGEDHNRVYTQNEELIATDFQKDETINYVTANLKDTEFRDILSSSANKQWRLLKGYVRRIIPRNPSKDAIINQSCLVLEHENKQDVLIIYTPHISNEEECPFYIPKVASVGILFKPNDLSVHYMPFASESMDSIKTQYTDQQQRTVRTALRLLQTAYKHSKGCKNGYSPKVKHDVIINKVRFQQKYLELKQKYGSYLVENWVESTDPKKHVFEEIAIAAFLLELWNLKFKGEYLENNSDFEFRDLGCGNGILTYILIMEGCKGTGIDARSRKSWKMFPENVQKSLTQQVIVPSILLRPNLQMKYMNPNMTDNNMLFQVPAQNDLISDKATILYSSKDLINSKSINIAEFTGPEKEKPFKNIFVIGNHSDELTCWIPLLGYPFMVIPCCSHNFSGAKFRFRNKSSTNNKSHANGNTSSSSTYGALVDKVVEISKRAGWDPVEKEMLRIPSTRNAAIIGIENKNNDNNLNQINWPNEEVYNIIMENGGANGWIANTMKLMSNKK